MWPAPESSPATAPSPNTRPTSGRWNHALCHREWSCRRIREGKFAAGRLLFNARRDSNAATSQRGEFSPVPGRIPRLRLAAALSRRCRRRTASAMSGRRPRVDRSTPRGRTKLVAGACRWARRGTATLRINRCRLSPATRLLVSPDWLIEDGLLRPSDARHPRFRKPPSITTRSSRSNTGCWRGPGGTSAPARVRR